MKLQTNGQTKAINLIEVLSDPGSAVRMLRPLCGQMTSVSGQCFTKAKEMDEALDQWLLYASELHAICTSIDGTDEEKLQAVSIDLLACRARVDYEAEKNSNAKDCTANLEKQMMMSGTTFQDISGSFPPGYESARN